MNADTQTLVREMTQASLAGHISFPKVVAALIKGGVERYHADLSSGRTTYYMPDGSNTVVESYHAPALAAEFCVQGVEQALRTIQRGEISYVEFCDHIAAAGCIAYVVSLSGKRTIYLGRDNDSFVEWFPGAKPGGAAP